MKFSPGFFNLLKQRVLLLMMSLALKVEPRCLHQIQVLSLYFHIFSDSRFVILCITALNQLMVKMFLDQYVVCIFTLALFRRFQKFLCYNNLLTWAGWTSGILSVSPKSLLYVCIGLHCTTLFCTILYGILWHNMALKATLCYTE